MDPDPRRPGKAYTAAGGFLADITGFDAAFFGLSPREASRMDPQQRLLLEMAREALDDAGIDPGTLAGSDSGVHVGVSNANYGQLQYARPEAITAYTMAGAALCNTANRISHLFDLRGPSMAMDTSASPTPRRTGTPCTPWSSAPESARTGAPPDCRCPARRPRSG